LFKGQRAKPAVTISRGPIKPVGLFWIELLFPNYGIHGKPECDKISKTESEQLH